MHPFVPSVEKLVVAEQDVLLVLHSAGRFLGSKAIEGLGAKAHAAKGLKGGVVGIVFLAGAVAPEGFTHVPLPFAVVKACFAMTDLLHDDRLR